MIIKVLFILYAGTERYVYLFITYNKISVSVLILKNSIPHIYNMFPDELTYICQLLMTNSSGYPEKLLRDVSKTINS